MLISNGKPLGASKGRVNRVSKLDGQVRWWIVWPSPYPPFHRRKEQMEFKYEVPHDAAEYFRGCYSREQIESMIRAFCEKVTARIGEVPSDNLEVYLGTDDKAPRALGDLSVHLRRYMARHLAACMSEAFAQVEIKFEEEKETA